MSDSSANLQLPFIAPAQAQKHVTHNEAIQVLDAVVQLSVVSSDAGAAPSAPADGARYIVPSGATGAWAGQEGRVALWASGGWIFLTPQPGWRAWVQDTGSDVIWDGTSWQPSGVDTVDLLGVNATADATNRLAVASDAVLLTHDGAGHQLKVNKATPADTASLLFQTGYSGRAEMGLAGTDAWSIKVSPDGSSWTDALSVDSLTGQVSGAAVQADTSDDTIGRLMTVGAFGLGQTTLAVSPAEIDSIGASGLYQLTGAVGSELDAGASLLHTQQSGTSATQIGFRAGADIVKWRRKVGGIWQDWQEIFSQARIVGTVSEVAGVPTGAVIESNSNANGNYIRFADGTQICNFTATATYVNASRLNCSWTFPAAFTAPPNVLPVMRERNLSNLIEGVGGSKDLAVMTNSVINSACSNTVFGSGFGTSDVVWMSLQAVGKWF